LKRGVTSVLLAVGVVRSLAVRPAFVGSGGRGGEAAPGGSGAPTGKARGR